MTSKEQKRTALIILLGELRNQYDYKIIELNDNMLDNIIFRDNKDPEGSYIKYDFEECKLSYFDSLEDPDPDTVVIADWGRDIMIKFGKELIEKKYSMSN